MKGFNHYLQLAVMKPLKLYHVALNGLKKAAIF